MTQRMFLVITMVLLAGWASGQIAQNPAMPTVPVLPSVDFQHPYKYTPPQIQFLPSPPWTASVRADPDSSGSFPLDGALAVTGQGKVIVQYNYLPAGTSTWPWRFNNSTNYGATWTAATLLASGTQFDNVAGGNKVDSCVAFVMKQTGGGYNFYLKRSTNSGVSWADTIHVPQVASNDFPDHPIMAYRNQNILVGFTDFGTGGSQYICVVRSTNWGTTWNASKISVSNSAGSGSAPAFAPAPSTTVYLAWGQPSGWMPTSIWFNKSTDLGATWGTPTQLLTLNMSGHINSMRPTHTFPSMCVAPNGTLYLTVMDMLHSSGWDIAFIKSTDGGTTWSTPVQVNDDVSTPNDDCFDNWMCVDQYNRPHVFWTDNRNYYNNGSGNEYGCDIYYSYSTNAGATWATNERVNDVTPIASTSGDFGLMGDYQQIDCDNTTIYVEWSDPSTSHNTAFVNTSTRPMPSGVEENPTGNPWVSHHVNGIELAPSRPNPVLNGTEMAFDLEKSSQTSLRVYDLTGKLVRTVVTGSLDAGFHTARWDTRDESGKPVASGVYFYRLESGGLTTTQKLVVAR